MYDQAVKTVDAYSCVYLLFCLKKRRRGKPRRHQVTTTLPNYATSSICSVPCNGVSSDPNQGLCNTSSTILTFSRIKVSRFLLSTAIQVIKSTATPLNGRTPEPSKPVNL